VPVSAADQLRQVSSHGPQGPAGWLSEQGGAADRSTGASAVVAADGRSSDAGSLPIVPDALPQDVDDQLAGSRSWPGEGRVEGCGAGGQEVGEKGQSSMAVDHHVVEDDHECGA
jgi:hypothetical protein